MRAFRREVRYVHKNIKTEIEECSSGSFLYFGQGQTSVNFSHLRATHIRLSATLNFAIQIAYVEKNEARVPNDPVDGDHNEQMAESGRAITPIAWAAAALTVHLFLEECNKSCEHSRSRIRRHVNCTHLLPRLHYMQRDIVRRILSVRPSVCPPHA